jgi:hypothetical protein
MHMKKLKIYYKLIVEGYTERNIFAYLTKVKFKQDFNKSNIQFTSNVNIAKPSINIAQGNLGGCHNLKTFKKNYKAIRSKHPNEKLFFLLDKDMPESLHIQDLIIKDNNIIQFIEHNSEYLLLKYTKQNPQHPTQFPDLESFRNYIKQKFKNHFKKEASELDEKDFDFIFNNIEDEIIKKDFTELFKTLT